MVYGNSNANANAIRENNSSVIQPMKAKETIANSAGVVRTAKKAQTQVPKKDGSALVDEMTPHGYKEEEKFTMQKNKIESLQVKDHY